MTKPIIHYYNYAGPYTHRDTAEWRLEDMFACGEVSEAEQPSIQRIGGHWFVCLRDIASLGR